MATPIKDYPAVGGPPVDHQKDMRPDPSDPAHKRMVWTGHTIDRTRAGKYTLHFEGQHVTRAWGFGSRIPFGADLKINPKDPTDVLWRDHHRLWHSIRKMLGSKRVDDIPGAITAWSDALTAEVGGIPSHTLPTHWPFNDFGHAVWYMVSEKTGKQSDQFIHETPENEREQELKRPVLLDYSHGCVHVVPADMDDMMNKHYLVNGTRFVIHRYDAVAPVVVPGAGSRRRHGRYVLHFFPGSKKIVVFIY